MDRAKLSKNGAEKKFCDFLINVEKVLARPAVTTNLLASNVYTK